MFKENEPKNNLRIVFKKSKAFGGIVEYFIVFITELLKNTFNCAQLNFKITVCRLEYLCLKHFFQTYYFVILSSVLRKTANWLHPSGILLNYVDLLFPASQVTFVKSFIAIKLLTFSLMTLTKLKIRSIMFASHDNLDSCLIYQKLHTLTVQKIHTLTVQKIHTLLYRKYIL